MSISYSNFFTDSDLLCGEETSSILSSDSPTESFSDGESYPPPEDEFIAGLIEDEGKFVIGFDYFVKMKSSSFDSDARDESIRWILKVKSRFIHNELDDAKMHRRRKTVTVDVYYCF